MRFNFEYGTRQNSPSHKELKDTALIQQIEKIQKFSGSGIQGQNQHKTSTTPNSKEPSANSLIRKNKQRRETGFSERRSVPVSRKELTTSLTKNSVKTEPKNSENTYIERYRKQKKMLWEKDQQELSRPKRNRFRRENRVSIHDNKIYEEIKAFYNLQKSVDDFEEFNDKEEDPSMKQEYQGESNPKQYSAPFSDSGQFSESESFESNDSKSDQLTTNLNNFIEISSEELQSSRTLFDINDSRKLKDSYFRGSEGRENQVSVPQTPVIASDEDLSRNPRLSKRDLKPMFVDSPANSPVTQKGRIQRWSADAEITSPMSVRKSNFEPGSKDNMARASDTRHLKQEDMGRRQNPTGVENNTLDESNSSPSSTSLVDPVDETTEESMKLKSTIQIGQTSKSITLQSGTESEKKTHSGKDVLSFSSNRITFTGSQIESSLRPSKLLNFNISNPNWDNDLNEEQELTDDSKTLVTSEIVKPEKQPTNLKRNVHSMENSQPLNFERNMSFQDGESNSMAFVNCQSSDAENRRLKDISNITDLTEVGKDSKLKIIPSSKAVYIDPRSIRVLEILLNSNKSSRHSLKLNSLLDQFSLKISDPKRFFKILTSIGFLISNSKTTNRKFRIKDIQDSFEEPLSNFEISELKIFENVLLKIRDTNFCHSTKNIFDQNQKKGLQQFFKISKSPSRKKSGFNILGKLFQKRNIRNKADIFHKMIFFKNPYLQCKLVSFLTQKMIFSRLKVGLKRIFQTGVKTTLQLELIQEVAEEEETERKSKAGDEQASSFKILGRTNSSAFNRSSGLESLDFISRKSTFDQYKCDHNQNRNSENNNVEEGVYSDTSFGANIFPEGGLNAVGVDGNGNIAFKKQEHVDKGIEQNIIAIDSKISSNRPIFHSHKKKNPQSKATPKLQIKSSSKRALQRPQDQKTRHKSSHKAKGDWNCEYMGYDSEFASSLKKVAQKFKCMTSCDSQFENLEQNLLSHEGSGSLGKIIASRELFTSQGRITNFSNQNSLQTQERTVSNETVGTSMASGELVKVLENKQVELGLGLSSATHESLQPQSVKTGQGSGLEGRFHELVVILDNVY